MPLLSHGLTLNATRFALWASILLDHLSHLGLPTVRRFFHTMEEFKEGVAWTQLVLNSISWTPETADMAGLVQPVTCSCLNFPCILVPHGPFCSPTFLLARHIRDELHRSSILTTLAFILPSRCRSHNDFFPRLMQESFNCRPAS